MEIVIGILAAAVVVAFIVVRAKQATKADAVRTQEFWQNIDDRNKEGTETNRRAWFPIFESLPVLDATTCPYIHLPIYDCSDDLFQLPCAHHTYSSRFFDHGIGFQDGEYIREWLLNFSISTSQGIPDNEGRAFVSGGDHFYLFESTGSIREPGSKVWRVVRTGKDEYHIWWWRAGIRPSASDLDPPYLINDIVKDPKRWLQRMDYVNQKLRFNSSYLSECKNCEHRDTQ